MAHHEDLLALARQMVDRNPGSQVEAELRRAVSTAYYALFHLLVDEGTARLVSVASIRPRVARTYEHKFMRIVCQEYAVLTPSAAGQPILYAGQSVPQEIVNVASAFAALHEARHQADYDLNSSVTHAQAEADVERAEQAFLDWMAVRSDPVADTFLAELWCRGIPKR